MVYYMVSTEGLAGLCNTNDKEIAYMETLFYAAAWDYWIRLPGKFRDKFI
jgi:hypothetical protein